MPRYQRILIYFNEKLKISSCYFHIFRRWTYNEIGNESPTCSLIECSVTSHEDDNNLDGGDFERVYVHESKFLIVPRCAGFSQIIYISRIDFKFVFWKFLIFFCFPRFRSFFFLLSSILSFPIKKIISF